MSYKTVHAQSIQDPHAFWGEQAKHIHWEKPFDTVLDYSKPPFAHWFKGGLTNLCYNAVDRHLAERGDQIALVAVSTETDVEKAYTFKELHAEVNRMAAILKANGVGKGDRVLIYMPMIAEASFAMLACARIGAIHSVVFGGFASHSLASRIEDATPKMIITAEAGMRGGKAVPYKPLLDEAIALSSYKPAKVLIVNRGLTEFVMVDGRDLDYTAERLAHLNAVVPVEWVDATHTSYILYTSGTTGKPKGVQRDTGGYAVALSSAMRLIFCGKPGETMFTTSDIGWVVGHSFIIYGPLINGTATIMYEGTPLRPDGGIWWSLVEKYKVSVMFSAPTAIRVLKKQDPAFLTKYDL
jgi:propionyl-CoA synthetase